MTEPNKHMKMIEVVARAICDDNHLKCTYPDCGCTTIKPKATAVIDALKKQGYVKLDELIECFDLSKHGIEMTRNGEEINRTILNDAFKEWLKAEQKLLTEQQKAI